GGRCALLRRPSATRRVGGVGVGAARRAVGGLLPRNAPLLRPHGGGPRDSGGPPLVPRVTRLLPPLARREGLGDDPADRPRPAGRVSAPADALAAGEGAVRRARRRRRSARVPRAGAAAGDAHAGGARPGRARRAGRVRARLLPPED